MQKKSKNGQKRENKTREKLSFFTLAKISLAKISPLKVNDASNQIMIKAFDKFVDQYQ